MNTIARLSRTALLVLPMTLATAASWAQTTGLTPVEVTGQRDTEVIRSDVQASCPALVQTLRDRLEPLAAKIDAQGEVQVDFTLDAEQPSYVRTLGGPVDLYPALKQALRSVHCQSVASSGPQRYRFIAAFVPQGSRDDSTRVALALR